jgi:quinol monooxygenase YgiN
MLTLMRALGFAPLAGLLCVVSAQAPAQPSTDPVRYAVTYVEVAPSRVADTTQAFKRYYDAINKEPGFASLDVFEQLGRAGHFALIETWRDQTGFDAHQAAASLTALKAALQPLRISGYDQRPYKTLTIAPARAAAGVNAVVVVSHVDIGGGGQVDVPAMLRKLADVSRAEPGCLRFDVMQHTMRANHFTVVEVWQDQEALDRHAAAAHTKQYRDDVQPVSGSPLDERAYRSRTALLTLVVN